MQDSCTIWVCQDCLLHHANGECGNCHENILAIGEGEDAHDREPWCWIDNADQQVTMGSRQEEHICGRQNGTYFDECDCDCEMNTFSWHSCDGCGSRLAGERYAFTLWFD